MTKNTNISLFSRAGGLDIGLEAEGFKTLALVEVDRVAQRTLEANRHSCNYPKFRLFGDINRVSVKELLEAAALEPGQATLVSAGPPCQSFSTAGRRGSITDPRGGLFHHFVRMVEGIQPRFFVMENVRGILSAALRHRPLHLRGPDSPPLSEKEELGSLLRTVILPALRKTLGYEVVYGLVNAADYGVPQMRRRVFFLGSRDGEFGSREWSPDEMPLTKLTPPTHSKEQIDGREPWLTLGDALEGICEQEPKFTPYSPSRKRVLELVPPGKNWRYLRDTYGDGYLRDVMGGAYGAGGGKVGFWRRLTYDAPCPTVPTSPIQKATSLCHPEETRPLSVQEYARVQQFPDDYAFSGSTPKKYTQIGNAVPVGLARAVGRALNRVIARQPTMRGRKLEVARSV